MENGGSWKYTPERLAQDRGDASAGLERKGRNLRAIVETTAGAVRALDASVS